MCLRLQRITRIRAGCYNRPRILVAHAVAQTRGGFYDQYAGQRHPYYDACLFRSKSRRLPQQTSRFPDRFNYQRGRTITITKPAFLLDWWYANLYNLIIARLPADVQAFWVESSCNGCGICQSVCPVGNIVLNDGKPHLAASLCTMPGVCAWCPKYGIQMRKKHIGRTRYHHPSVQSQHFLPTSTCHIGERAMKITDTVYALEATKGNYAYLINGKRTNS